VKATTTSPYYVSSCTAVECPINSSGEQGVPGGCACDIGYSGSVEAITTSPYHISTCKVNVCSARPCAPTDGIVAFSSNDYYGSIASFSCNPGFTLSGEATVTCDATVPYAPWEIAATLPTCTVNSCSAAPSAPSNGFVTFSATNDHGSIATFGCNSGFTRTISPLLATDQVVKCAAITPGNPWGSPIPPFTCKGMPCIASSESSADGSKGFLYCTNGGSVAGTAGSCTCTCKSGYTGKGCEIVETCLENEHVFSHECTECPDGKINTAGDQASFEDTFCVCTNTEPEWMKIRGWTCSDFAAPAAMEKQCTSPLMLSEKHCRQACFDAGAGYHGDDCAVEKACAVTTREDTQMRAQVEPSMLIMETATRHIGRRRSKVCTCAFGTPAGAAKCLYSEENCMSCENGYSLKRAKGAYSGREVAICKKQDICST